MTNYYVIKRTMHYEDKPDEIEYYGKDDRRIGYVGFGYKNRLEDYGYTRFQDAKRNRIYKLAQQYPNDKSETIEIVIREGYDF